MRSNKKVVTISDNEELHKSFERAFNAVNSLKVTKYLGRFNTKQNVVINITENTNEIDSWLWGEFRKKALNPLIVIGTEDKSSFMDKNPVFKNYSEEHVYIQIPFNLSELLKTIDISKPIYDHVTRKLILNDYSKGYEYKLITHDLKIIKGDKNTTVVNLLAVKDFYKAKGETKIVKIIDDKVKEIQKKDVWEQIPLEIKRYLEERLKGRSKL